MQPATAADAPTPLGLEVSRLAVFGSFPAPLGPPGRPVHRPVTGHAAMQHYLLGGGGNAPARGVPAMLAFLAGLAVLVAVNVATRRAQRDTDHLGAPPVFRVPE